jgi:hypothetical protein
MNVTVSGVYEGGLGNSGPALGTLDDSACPKETTWIEIALQSTENRKELKEILDKSGRAYVVFEGELSGPPVPDPKLPDTIRKNLHPGWGHLGAFKTKLVVHEIREVAVAPPTPMDALTHKYDAQPRDASFNYNWPALASSRGRLLFIP